MRSAIVYVLGTLVLSAVVFPMASLAQKSEPAFDPTHPFVDLKDPKDWVKRFSGKPIITPNDPYGNLSLGELGRDVQRGENLDEPNRSIESMKGGGGRGWVIRSPYPYKTADEQYNAWLTAADGGTKITRATLPDWSGDWTEGGGGGPGNDRITDVLAAVSDPYKPRFVQKVRAEWLEHSWGPTGHCLPSGLMSFWGAGGASVHFMSDEHMVLLNKDRFNEDTRYIYTDGRGYLPKDLQFSQWLGASVAFWAGDELVVHTAQVKRWIGAVEYSDKLETVERIKRFGDQMLIDITLYDPEAFTYPWHEVTILKIIKDWTQIPATYQDCVSTNNNYMTKTGDYNEYTPGDLEYRDLSDSRPWATAFKRWDEAHPSVPQWTVPK